MIITFLILKLFIYIAILIGIVILTVKSISFSFGDTPFLDNFIEKGLLYAIYKNRKFFSPIVTTLFVFYTLVTIAMVISLYYLPEPDIIFLRSVFPFYVGSIVILFFSMLFLAVANIKLQKAELKHLSKERLNPHFITNYPVAALREAFPMFETLIREKAKLGKELNPENLINKVFSAQEKPKKEPEKKVSNEKQVKLTYSERTNEQNGLRDIIRGINAFYRNPLMHSDEQINDHSALIILLLLDELTQIVNECELTEVKEDVDVKSHDESIVNECKSQETIREHGL